MHDGKVLAEPSEEAWLDSTGEGSAAHALLLLLAGRATPVCWARVAGEAGCEAPAGRSEGRADAGESSTSS